MRTKIKKLTSVCLAVIMILGMLTVAPITAGAAEENSESVSAKSGDFEYELYDDILSITGYSGNAENLTIPSEIDGYTVTGIDWNAFENCTSLTSVEIPETVTYIGGSAFEDCTSLKSVTIPNSVTYIGSEAFLNTALSGITIPASVQSISTYAFGYMYNEDNWDPEMVDGFTIYGYTNSEAEVYAKDNGFKFVSLGTVSPYGYDVLEDGTASITRYRGSEADLTIPSEIDGYKVTQIFDGAFHDNENLKSVTIPNTVTYIGQGAFAFCTSLADINIPDSVTYIDSWIFAETKWYENQPEGVVYAGNFAYAYKGEMPAGTTITLKNGTKGIVGGAFNQCVNLKGITIPDSVTYIGAIAFKNTGLSSITIPHSVTSIEYAAFQNCENLKSVTIPADVEYIGLYAFGYFYDEISEKMVKVDGFTIYGYTGSDAERYANENGFKFVSLSADPTQKLGDVNGDGSISIDDATAVQKYLANMLDLSAELADVDKNGSITIDDVTLIQKYLAGLAEI